MLVSAAAVTGAFALAGAVATAQQAPRYDVVIANGSVVDGSGNPWYRADVGIRDGHIVAVGRIDSRNATVLVDAAGKMISPGFIDLHTHSDVPLLVDGLAQSKVRQGVTLDVLGESLSVAPLEGVVLTDFKNQTKQRYNIDVDWTTVAGYFARLRKQGTSINVATGVAPQQVKRGIIGYQDRPATPGELERMEGQVAQAMREGAVGLSTAYEGGGYDNPGEIFAMAKVAAQHGGYYASHVGSEGYELVEEVEKAIQVAEETGIPVHIYHLKIRGKNLWGKIGPVIEQIEKARARGLDITANQYPYTAMQHPWGAIFPSWAKTGPPGTVAKVLADPANRAKLKADKEYQQYLDEHGSYEGTVGSRYTNPALKQYEGKTVAEVAKLRGDTDMDKTLFDLVQENGNFPDGIFHNQSEDDIKTIMRLPWVAVAADGRALAQTGVLAEGFPHPRSFGTNPRVLGKYVREEHNLALEDAVRKMTSFPAQILRLKDRGLVKEGYWADLVVFDPKTVKDNSTFVKPALYPTGINHVFVNGVQVVKDGEHTGAKPGKIVYGAGHVATTPSEGN
jgi:N-acyl-D-aspartate/D-glutamate deacylase